jgi:hypothetical protein
MVQFRLFKTAPKLLDFDFGTAQLTLFAKLKGFVISLIEYLRNCDTCLRKK